MKRRVQVLLVLAGVIAAATAAYAMGYLSTLFPGFDDGGTLVLTHNRPAPGQGVGPLTTLRIHKGANQPDGTLSLSFELDIEDTGVLISALLQTCSDTNSNGILDAAEWVTVAAAPFTENGGITHAASPVVVVSSELDGYRIVYDRSDIGLTRDYYLCDPDVDFPPLGPD